MRSEWIALAVLGLIAAPVAQAQIDPPDRPDVATITGVIRGTHNGQVEVELKDPNAPYPDCPSNQVTRLLKSLACTVSYSDLLASESLLRETDLYSGRSSRK